MNQIHRAAVDELPPLIVTSFAQMSFLVIDDDAAVLDETKAILQKAAVGVVKSVAGSFAGVGLLTEKDARTDCIICKNELDGLSGLALLKRIRASRNAVIPRDTRFILLTKQPHRDIVTKARALDINGIVSEPLAAGALLRAVHLAFGRPLLLKQASDYAKVAL